MAPPRLAVLHVEGAIGHREAAVEVEDGAAQTRAGLSGATAPYGPPAPLPPAPPRVVLAAKVLSVMVTVP